MRKVLLIGATALIATAAAHAAEMRSDAPVPTPVAPYLNRYAVPSETHDTSMHTDLDMNGNLPRPDVIATISEPYTTAAYRVIVTLYADGRIEWSKDVTPAGRADAIERMRHEGITQAEIDAGLVHDPAHLPRK